MVPNFIDINKYDSQARDCNRNVLASGDEKIITHVSNFRKVKRIDDVIKIFYKIQEQLHAKLIMVGQGPEREMAENLAFELGIEEKVLFLGQSNEIDKILRCSDLFLLPSDRESFGLAALEAMVNEVPVISTNTGGLPEVNRHGFSGFLSDVGNVEEMAHYAVSILQDEETLNRFKTNAKEQASLFDLYSVMPLYEDLYQRALQHPLKGASL